jgi:lysophospholipase L1-like esterase
MIAPLLYAAASAVVGLVVSELIARVWVKSRDRWYIHQPFARRHTTIATDVLPQLPEVATFEANADGERGGPVPANPSQVLRVVVAGGSAAECYLLDQDATSSAVLERELASHPKVTQSVHVGNIARSLITCRKINAILGRALPHLESLDAVVLMVGASDLVDWFEAKTPDTIDEPPFELANYVAEHPEGPFAWKPKQMALYQIVRGLNVRLRRPVEVKKRAGGSIAKHRAARAATDNLLTEAPDPAPMLESFEHHLRALIETCRVSAKHVIIAQQPWLDRDFTDDDKARLWNFGQGSPYRGALDAYYDIDLVRSLMERVDEVAARVGDDLGAPRVDLRQFVPSDFEHYYDFLHHTPIGAELVGAAIAKTIAGLET